jgi:hypothetical protein
MKLVQGSNGCESLLWALSVSKARSKTTPPLISDRIIAHHEQQ